MLKVQGNEVEIFFVNEYSKEGTGLHSYTEAKTNFQYLYSQGESYNCHRIFPCFDQPDIKATFELTVACPKSWKVIANCYERHSTALGEDEVFQVYEKSDVFSTYLFAVCAGPYLEIEQEE